jgi:AcrR family transcriptional regulator
MGTMERRERERQEMRQRILEAARELMVTEGYERMTMRRIAEAIEYSPTAIYHHFKDKDEVVLTLCDEDFGRLLGALQDRPLPEDPLERVRALGLAYARFGLQYPNHYRFMFMTPAKPTHDDWGAARPGWQAFELLRGAVRTAMERRQVRAGSLDAFTQVLWSSLHGAIALLVTFRPEQFPVAPPVDDLIEQVIANGLRGLLAAPAPEPPSERAN